MTTESNGMAYAGNAHSRFDEGGVASAKPRRRSMLCNKTISRIAKTLAVCASFITVPCFGGTVAVYEFKERPVGQSAVGVPIVNSVGVTHVGTATATATGSLLYSADAPGKFIVDGSGIVIKKPQSLLFGSSESSVAGKGANVAFDAINDVLSSNSATNYTVEFFMKMASASYSNNAIVKYDDGWYYSSGHLGYEGISGTSMGIWAMNGTCKLFRFGPNYTNPFIFAKTFTESLSNQWHHVAIVMSNRKLSVYLDYGYVYADSSGKVAFDMTYNSPTNGPLNFGMNNFRGNFCGLRISDRALTTSGFMRVSDSYPNGDTLSHLSFDSQTPDADMTGDVESCSLLNSVAPSYVGKGVAMAGPDGETYPVAAAVPRRPLTTEDDDVTSTNKCSMRLSVCPSTYATVNHLRGPFVKVPVYDNLLGNYNGDVTIEAFFKYDETDVVSTLDKLSNPRYRMTLMGLGNGNAGANVDYVWLLMYDLKSKKLFMYVDGREIGTGKTVYPTSGFSGVHDLSGSWHHIAVRFDKTAQTFYVYLDYEQALEFNVATANANIASYSVRGLYYFIGSTQSIIPATAFNGWIDDFRVTAGLLPVSRFLKMSGFGGCKIIIM